MIRRMYQCDIAMTGVVTSSEESMRPGPNQRIVLDYLYYYLYMADVTDLVQIDTYGITATDRKTLFYMNPTVAVHYAPIAVQLNLPLYPGEYFQCWAQGHAATSHATLIVWYHIEDVTNVQSGNVKACDLISFITGKCSS